MKKILTSLLLAFLFFAAFSIQSCKKCATCSYTYQLAGEPVATYTYPELCGSNSDIDDYEYVCQQAAAAYNNTCACTEN